MSKPKGSFYGTLVGVLCLAAALLLPILRGEDPIRLGLDLSGGMVVTYRPDFDRRLEGYEGLEEEALLQLAKETLVHRLTSRLNTLPDVVVRGDQRIQVSLPGLEDHRRALDLIGKTWHLSLRLVEGRHSEPIPGRTLFPYGGRFLELAPAEFSGHMLDEGAIQVQTGGGASLADALAGPEVVFRFRAPHDDRFAEFTGGHVGRELAILLDDRVEWAGTIESAIVGSGVLRGAYSFEQATEVAAMLRSGSLPVSLEVEDLSAVGPSLGQEIQESGLQALALASTFLLLLLGVAYAHRRVFLWAGLFSLAFLLLAIAGLAAVFGMTLDLVGIAGIILSVGMGMDAFILVFEALEARMEGMKPQELRARGKHLLRGVYRMEGEGRTLFHANVTTLGVVLMLLAADRLESFALFILLGLAASGLTIFVTREILRHAWMWSEGKGMGGRSILRGLRPGVFRGRRIYAAVVTALFLVTLGAFVAGGAAGPQVTFGDDFRPGTQMVVSAPTEGLLDEALARLDEHLPGVRVRQQSLGEGEGPRRLVTMGRHLGGEAEGGLEPTHLLELLAVDGVEVGKLMSIDGKVSSRRMMQGLSVLCFSALFLAFYFLVCQRPVDRFFLGTSRRRLPTTNSWVVGGILLALLVDVGVILALIAWQRLPVELPVIAALLTIIGYSVNDSVVLWSHVQNRWARADDPATSTSDVFRMVSESIDSILGRAVLTSLSTMVPALAILWVGLSPLRDFALVMIVGTISGTLSSIFVVGSGALKALTPDELSSTRKVAASTI